MLDKKINLGLDLQGGSYLLLEIDNTPIIEQKLQNLTITLRNYFKEKNIRLKNLKLDDEKIFFSVNDEFQQTVLDEFNNENSIINPYYQIFKSHQLEISKDNDNFYVNFFRQGIIELKNFFSRSSLRNS